MKTAASSLKVRPASNNGGSNSPKDSAADPLANLIRQKGALAAFLYEKASANCLAIEHSSRFPAALCRGLALILSKIGRDFESKENSLSMLHLEFHEVAVLTSGFGEHMLTLLAEPEEDLRFLSNCLLLVTSQLETDTGIIEEIVQKAVSAPKARGRRANQPPTRGGVPAEFFAQLRDILAEHAGPTAGRNLLHRAMREMELTEVDMPRAKVSDLLGAISVRIASRARRQVFLSEASQMARGMGLTPATKKKLESRAVSGESAT